MPSRQRRIRAATHERYKALKQVLSDPSATPADRVKAAALLERIEVRKERRAKVKAAEPERPAVEARREPLSPEVVAELQKRGLLDENGEAIERQPVEISRMIDVGDGRGKQLYTGRTLDELTEKLREAQKRAFRQPAELHFLS